MEFTFDTVYDQRAMTAMARTLRKTLRKKRSRCSHIFGRIVVILALLFIFLSEDRFLVFNLRTIVTGLAVLMLLCALIWEDQINGYVARKRMLKGMERAVSVFREDGYSSKTEIGQTEWNYDKIEVLSETKDYFVFLFSRNHAQLYDKRSMTGGSLEQFRSFIQRQTGKKMEEG